MKKENWLYKVFLLTFILSIIFSSVTTLMSENFNNIIIFIILLLVIVIGIIADMVGVATLTRNEATFHAKASKKIKGAKEAIVLIKNSVKISSICNDVIGDICGIISGGLGTVVTLSFANTFSLPITFSTILITAVVSSLTVGGKAMCKNIASKKCDEIVFLVGKVLNFLKF